MGGGRNEREEKPGIAEREPHMDVTEVGGQGEFPRVQDDPFWAVEVDELG